LFERKCGADLTLFFNDTEMSWCRTVFFNGCRNVLVPNCIIILVLCVPLWINNSVLLLYLWKEGENIKISNSCWKKWHGWLKLFERKCGADLTLFFNDTEMSWCRTVFFNGCRNVLVPNCLFQRVPNCLVSNFILPGQLILLAFLVETFFFKPAMSFFSTWIRNFYTRWKRQFGTKTFRYRWKKVSNRHRIFFQTNVITFFKIKSTKIKKKHQWSFKCNQNIIYLHINFPQEQWHFPKLIKEKNMFTI
jgi:hypothetical protein